MSCRPGSGMSVKATERSMRDKVLASGDLKREIERLRGAAGGRFRLVFTNGCFDILHVGHLRYLVEARAQGDALVVALNSDESVRRLKGERRPVLGLKDRMAVMAGLACVDWVTWFEEDKPLGLLEELRPEVLVKGANYGIEGVVGRELAEGWGAEVMTLSLVEGSSTSGIIERVMATRQPGPGEGPGGGGDQGKTK